MSLSVLYSGTVANAAGDGAGGSVSVAVSVPYTPGSVQYPGVLGQIPNPPSGPLAGVGSNYAVIVNPSQAAMINVTGQSSSGFTVTLTPSDGVTLAAGTFNVVVLG